MTTNHPAHGPVSLDRLHQIREILSKAAAQSDGGNLGYAMADAVKVIDGAIAAFGAEPVGYTDAEELRSADNEIWMWKSPHGFGKDIPLYSAQPSQVVPDDGREQFEAWMLEKWGRERQEYDFAMGKFLHGENYADSYTRHMWKAWSASRAAMLQAEPVSQRYKLPPNSFTDEDLEGMIHGNNPQSNAYRELLAFRRNSQWIGIDQASEPDRSVEVRYFAPPGYAMVPKDLTCAMDDAAWEAYHETRCMSDIWAALLASAPPQEVK